MPHRTFATVLWAALAMAAAVDATAQTPLVTWSGETMRLASANVTPLGGSSFAITMQMANDNGNGALPTSFRRWWHAQIGNLPLGGSSLQVTVTNAGYSDVILPVWSLSTDGVTFGAYTRVPTAATPTVIGTTQHRFTLAVPPGVVALRLAKFFPYGVSRKDAFLASLAGEPRLRSIVSLGPSRQGRPVHLMQWTDSSVPDTNKQRVWIHAGVHPAETTGYLMVEGLVAWLRSGDPMAEVLLDRTLLDIVPMANPDGVAVGNYRTNVDSINLENQWSAPYQATHPELVALRTAIEARMGTVAQPASNPIRVLLNLHATHNIAFPFHFLHTSNPSFNLQTNATGVLPIVHALELQWIASFRARSPFVALGIDLNSSLVSRPFVESMVHDRWTAQPGWLGAPGFQAPVMAITFEGTYGRGPDGVTWNTEADHRQCGEAMGRALFDHLGLAATASATSYFTPCQSLQIAAVLSPLPDLAHAVALDVSAGAPNGLAVLVVGSSQVFGPLPAPWSNCALLTQPDVTLGFTLDANGAATLNLRLPAASGLAACVQVVAFDPAQLPSLVLDASNGVRFSNDY